MTGGRGRPTKVIDPDWLREAVHPSRNYSLTKIAKLCNCSAKKVLATLRENGISHGYTPMEEDELDKLIRYYRQQKPTAGYRYTMGWLYGLGIKIHERPCLGLFATD